MSHDHACTWELLARCGLRTVFQVLDTSPGLGGIIRDSLRQFRYSRVRRSCDMSAGWLCVWIAFLHHPRDMATSRKSQRTTACGRAKRQFGARIIFQNSAPLTACPACGRIRLFPSLRNASRAAAQSNGLGPRLSSVPRVSEGLRFCYHWIFFATNSHCEQF